MFRNRLVIILIIVAVVLVIVLIVGKKRGWIGGGTVTEVSVEKVSKRNITERVSASGKIYPHLDVKISPDVSGEIVELYVEEGDSVKAGQVLAKIKPDIYQAMYERAVAAQNTSQANYLQAKAAVTQGQAEFDRAEKTYNRNKTLHDQKVISDADWETIESAYKTAKAAYEGGQMNVDAAQYNVQSAQASVREAQEDLRKTTIYAPINGILTRLNIEKGERVLGTTQMEGTDMMHISDLNAIESWVDVSESDVLRVKVGDTTEIKLDAYPDQKFKGIVTQIGKSAKEAALGQSEQVTNFQVKILLLQNSYKSLFDSLKQKFPFLPGMSASVDIMTKEATNVLSVPIQSVTTREDTSSGGAHSGKSKNLTAEEKKKSDATQNETVFINNKGKAKAVKVTTGIQDDEYIEIKTGLKGDEEAVSGPFTVISRMLKDGDAIKVVDKSKLFKAETEKK
ncbi:MAG TPA: efflux RND transporter periplasmic adaptor subunit [Chitinophagales bacterium]|nr:efflux RND transporter periplasmic adaptor subunit [Chitinophagales bacterium]